MTENNVSKLNAEVLVPSSIVSDEIQKKYNIIAYLTSFGWTGGRGQWEISLPIDYIITIVIEKNSFNIFKKLLTTGIYFDLKLLDTTYICCVIEEHKEGNYCTIDDYVFNDELKIICLRVKK